MGGLSALASNPAWLKAAVAQKALTASTPEEAAAMSAMAQRLKQLDTLVGDGLTAQQAMALRRSLERSKAAQTIQEQIQTPLPFADGGNVKKKSVWNRTPDSSQHMRSSGQMEPDWERYLATNERINPAQGLESPMLDPLDPINLPKSFPIGALKMLRVIPGLAFADGGKVSGAFTAADLHSIIGALEAQINA